MICPNLTVYQNIGYDRLLINGVVNKVKYAVLGITIHLYNLLEQG